MTTISKSSINKKPISLKNDNQIYLAIESEVKAALECLSEPQLSDDEKVHRTRKGLKRCRAYLHLLRGSMAETDYYKLNAAMRSSGKLLAMQRRASVHLKTVGQLMNSYSNILDTAEWEIILHHLNAEYKQLYDPSDTLKKQRFHMVEHQLLHHVLHPLQSIQMDIHPEYITHMFNQSVTQFIKRFHNPKNFHSAGQAHQFRKAAKRLFYQTQLLNLQSMPYFTIDLEQLDKMCDELGLDHDLADLQLWLNKKHQLSEHSKLLKKLQHFLYLEMIKHRIQAFNYVWIDLLLASQKIAYEL